MHASAPAKLILSGEHAVVYGKPALAMAMNHYAKASVMSYEGSGIYVDMPDIAHSYKLGFQELSQLKKNIFKNYQRFQQGELGIRHVLKERHELAQMVLAVLSDRLSFHQRGGIQVNISSAIPMGCGLGSSAAIILSVMIALINYYELKLSQEEIFTLALQIENLQHGVSSGLDLKVILQGGCLYMQDKVVSTRKPPAFPMFLVNTGTPLSSTGQCVEHAASFFKKSSLSEDFAEVTHVMDHSLEANNAKQFMQAVQENQRLLTRIGVVPANIQQFVKLVEDRQGCAKICGAGAVEGNQAGVMLLLGDDEDSLKKLSAQFDFVLTPFAVDHRGVHMENNHEPI